METKDKLLKLINNTIENDGVAFSGSGLQFYHNTTTTELELRPSSGFIQGTTSVHIVTFRESVKLHECSYIREGVWYDSKELDKIAHDYSRREDILDKPHMLISFKEGEPTLELKTHLVSEVASGGGEVHTNEYEVDDPRAKGFWGSLRYGGGKIKKTEKLTIFPIETKRFFTVKFGDFNYEITEEEAMDVFDKCVEKLFNQKERVLDERIKDYEK